jgi:hypothetical protein
MIGRTCERCAASFAVRPYEVKRGRGRFCSHACAAPAAVIRRDQTGKRNPKWRGGVRSVDRKNRYRQTHPERHSAHAQMTKAIRAGSLVRQPCEVCGSPDVEGHHDDYSRPLLVRWLCKPHHLAAHGGRRNNHL